MNKYAFTYLIEGQKLFKNSVVINNILFYSIYDLKTLDRKHDYSYAELSYESEQYFLFEKDKNNLELEKTIQILAELVHCKYKQKL